MLKCKELDICRCACYLCKCGNCSGVALCLPMLDMTIGRQIIAEVNIADLDFNLLIDEDLLWTGKHTCYLNDSC